jgi:hypothetical protein
VAHELSHSLSPQLILASGTNISLDPSVQRYQSCVASNLRQSGSLRVERTLQEAFADHVALAAVTRAIRTTNSNAELRLGKSARLAPIHPLRSDRPLTRGGCRRDRLHAVRTKFLQRRNAAVFAVWTGRSRQPSHPVSTDRHNNSQPNCHADRIWLPNFI